MIASSLPAIAPADVHAVLARHMLADGHDIVFDMVRFGPDLTATEADTALEIVRKSLKEL